MRGGAPSSGDVSETSSSSPLDAYTTATDRFEKTVSLVQKMMTGTVGTPRTCNCSVSFLLFPNLSVSVVLAQEQSYIRSGLIDILGNLLILVDNCSQHYSVAEKDFQSRYGIA